MEARDAYNFGYDDGRKSKDQEIAEYENRIAQLKADRLTYCAYCGQEFPIDAEGTPTAVSEHIMTCLKHPIYQIKQEYEAKIAELTRKGEELCGAYGNALLEINGLKRQIAEARKEGMREEQDRIKFAILHKGYLIKTDKHGLGYLVPDDLWVELFPKEKGL